MPQNLERFGRAVLRQDEKSLRFFLRCAGTVQYFFEQRHGTLGVAVHQAGDREHFELFVRLCFRVRGLSARLPHLDLQRLRIFYPAALRKFLLQVGDGCQRGVSFSEFVLRVGLPIHRRIRLRPVHVRKFAEFPGRLVVTVFVERLASVAVELIEPFQALLLAVAFFLFPVAFFLLSIAGFLFAILGILALPRFRWRARAAVGRSGPRQLRCDQQRRRNHPNVHHPACAFSDAHALFLSLAFDSVAAGAEFVVFCFSCNSLPTTRTLNKMPCASIRCRIVSSSAGVTSCGLCATSISTRSRSSRTLASAASPSCLAVSRYNRFASSKSSARRCSAEILICFCPGAGGVAFASSINTISDFPKCSPTATMSTRSRTWATLAAGDPESFGFDQRPATNAAITMAAIAPMATQRRGSSHVRHPRPALSGSRGAISCHTARPYSGPRSGTGRLSSALSTASMRSSSVRQAVQLVKCSAMASRCVVSPSR